MGRILGIFPQYPPYRVEQEDVLRAVAAWLPAATPGREKLLQAYEHSGVGARFSVVPIEEALCPPSFTERNRRYGEAMVELGTSAVSRALAAGGWEPERFHTIIAVSCTGFMIPSVDVHIINRLGLHPSIRRLPITELGCAAGAAAVSRASELVEAHAALDTCRGSLARADLAVILAAEFPSLNFQPGDSSAAHVISGAIFGDAVVAAVLGPGSSEGAGGPRVVATRSYLIPRTPHLMGFELGESGFHIVLSREIPFFLRELLRGLVEEFLEDVGWRPEELNHWVIHPGGEKILRTFLEIFELPAEAMEDSRAVLREWGNGSSAAVLLVLERAGRRARKGDRGLLVAFGPGFCAELIALEW